MMTGEPSGKWMLGVRAVVGQASVQPDKNVYVFSIGSTGALISAIPTSTPFPPTYVVVSPNDKFVYTFNEDRHGHKQPYLPAADRWIHIQQFERGPDQCHAVPGCAFSHWSH